MKKTILTLAIATLFVGGLITACQSSESKVENAEDNVMNAEEELDDANMELNQARRDSIQLWKEETVSKISANEQSIVELKSKIAIQKKENKAKYEERVAVLEQKNADLKRKLGEFTDDGKSDWQMFKDEFNRDLDELGRAFKDLTVKNNK